MNLLPKAVPGRLHEIAAEIARLRSELIAQDGEIDVEQECLEGALEVSFVQKLQRLALIRQEIVWARDLARAKADTWQAAAARASKRLGRLDDYLASCMRSARISKAVVGVPDVNRALVALENGDPAGAAAALVPGPDLEPRQFAPGERTALEVTVQALEALPSTCRQVRVTARRAEIRKLLKLGVPMPDGVEVVATPCLKVTKPRKPRKGAKR